MAYNMTSFGEGVHILALFEAINTSSGNLLVYFSLITIFIIVLVALLRHNPPPEAFTGAGATGTVISLLFLAIGLVGVEWVIGFALIFATSAVSLYITNKL